MIDVEQAGLVKFDFLGLKTLTIIDNATLELVNRQSEGTRRSEMRIDTINLMTLLRLSCCGRENYRRIPARITRHERPDEKGRLLPLTVSMMALVALFRPGPLQLVR